jgi:hypothetical protein
MKSPGLPAAKTVEQAILLAQLQIGRVSGPFGAATKLAMPPSTLESKFKALRIEKSRFKPVPPSRNRNVPSRDLREAS